MNGFRHGFKAVLLISALVGCASGRISQHDRLNPEPFNPYLKYLSPEPYWHYNFYPEPRWEYTYGLYSYPNPFSATIYSCHVKDKPHRLNGHLRESKPHEPRPDRSDKPAKPVKTPNPVKIPTTLPVKLTSSRQPPKQLEPKPAQSGAAKDDKSIKPRLQPARDTRVPDKPGRPSIIDFKKPPETLAELEKPPGLRADGRHENDSLQHSQTDTLPVDSRSASINTLPKGLIDPNQHFLHNQSSGHQNNPENTVNKHRKFKADDSKHTQISTDISATADNRKLGKAPTKSKEPSSNDLAHNKQDRQEARTTIDSPIDRISKPTENSMAIEIPHSSVQKPIQEQSVSDSHERFHSSDQPAISDNFDRKPETRNKSPIRESNHRMTESIKEAPHSAPVRIQIENLPSRQIGRAIESVTIRHENPPDPTVRKIEPEPKPVMRSESVNPSRPAHEQPGKETQKNSKQ